VGEDAKRVVERLIVGAVALTERSIAEAGTDLTFVQWRVLLIVGEQPGGATVGEIAARIGARASPASRLITRLRRRGVVATEKDPEDARVTRVRLTDDGRELRARVLRHRRAELEAVVRALAPTAADVATLRQLARALEAFS
jgi:DNA-binding MarR family transcriptional regulator